MLNSNPTVSTSEIAEQTGVSYGSLRHHLEKMKRENLIRRVGSDKGGRWLVIS